MQTVEEVLASQLFDDIPTIFRGVEQCLKREPPDYIGLLKLFHWSQSSETVARIFKAALVARPDDCLPLLKLIVTYRQVHSGAFCCGVAIAYFQAAVEQDGWERFSASVFHKDLSDWVRLLLDGLGKERVAPGGLEPERKTLGPVVKQFLRAEAVKERLQIGLEKKDLIAPRLRSERLMALSEIIAEEYEKRKVQPRPDDGNIRELIASEIRFAIFRTLNPFQQSKAIALWYKSRAGLDREGLTK